MPGAPRLEFSGNLLKWNATDDAVGWRLFNSAVLNPANWQAITNSLSFTNGKVQYNPPLTQPSGFYRLQRPERK